MNNLKRYTLYFINMIDIVSIVLSYWTALLIRKSPVFFRNRPLYMRDNYDKFLLITIIAYIVYNVLFLYSDDRFVKRNAREEFSAVIKTMGYILLITVVFLYFAKMGETFSRLFVAIFFGVFFIVNFALKQLLKQLIKRVYVSGAVSEKVLIVTKKALVCDAVKKIRNDVDWRYMISGIVITDEDLKGESIDGIKVISNREDMFADIAEWDVDSILILHDNDEGISTIKQWMHQFRKLGKIIHVHVPEYELYDSFHTMDTVGDYAVVTYRVYSPMPRRQQLFRRIVNFIGALILLPVYAVVYLIVALFTAIESPGHILISRVRVGKNNRRYYQYRFRVFRTDAKEREAQGKSPYTLIGRFLRTSHLDGLPMILNVLIGDVAFVGPKAPNLNKYLSMTSRERNVLSITPGIVGYWSLEKEQEKITKDEGNYIGHWNILKDLEIIALMILRYVAGKSLRIDGDTHLQEEYDFIEEIKRLREPYHYPKTYSRPQTFGYSLYHFIKRVFDILISALALVVLSPLFLILTVLVMGDDGGSPFYAHERIGKDGRRITVFKFRTMRMDAGDLTKLLTPEQLEQYQREFKIDDDPRVTNLGNFLRRSSLDELPQLFNVLGGTMSFVGPRPLTEEEMEFYGNDVAKLLSVRPGLTGYWQAYARNNATYETGERQKMEMYYIDHQGLLFDLRIILKTIGTVISGEGAQ